MMKVYLRIGRWGRIAQLTALGAGCLALAGCAGNVSNGQHAARGGGSNTATALHTPATPYTASRVRPARAARAAPVQTQRNGTAYSAVGTASWYGADFHGRPTATGETYNMDALTAAHPTLPIPCTVRVTNLANKRSVTVRVNDRGPFVGGRVIDVSAKTARALGFYDRGLAKVKIDYVGPARREAAATAPE